MAAALTQVMMYTSLVSATQKEGTKMGPRRHSTKALPSLESSQESPGDPQLHRGEVNTSFRITCYRPRWPTNLHAFQGRLSLPLDSHAWYTGKGTVVGCGLHSSRVLVDFQLLCSLSSSSAEKGVLFPVGIHTGAWAESRPQNHWLALPPTLDGYFLNVSSFPSH